MINAFSAEVQQKLKYYAYVLVDPRTDLVFYVGHGCGNRVFEHEAQPKLNTVLDLLKQNKSPKKYIVTSGLTKEQAIKVETALINVFLHQSAPLENINSGHATQIAYECVEHVENKYHKVSLTKDDLNLFEGRKMLIKLPTQSMRILSDENKVLSLSTKHTRLPYDIAVKPELIFATANGVIIQVYRAERWNMVEKASSITAGGKYRYYQCNNLIPDIPTTKKLKYRKIDLRHGFHLRSGSILYYDIKRNGE